MDAARHGWAAYAGVTAALQGDIREDGWRLRSLGSYAAYHYSSPRWTGTAKVPVDFEGRQQSLDLLAGYQRSFGPLIVKAFAGATYSGHAVTPFDTESTVQGGRTGVKAALETWLAIGSAGFIQADANWTQVFETYGTRLRGGIRLTPEWSLGGEAAAHGNSSHDAARIGPFVRFDWAGGEVSASAGAASDYDSITGPYGTLSVQFRF